MEISASKLSPQGAGEGLPNADRGRVRSSERWKTWPPQTTGTRILGGGTSTHGEIQHHYPEKFQTRTLHEKRRTNTRKVGGSMSKRNEKIRSWHMYSSKSKPHLGQCLPFFFQIIFVMAPAMATPHRHLFRNQFTQERLFWACCWKTGLGSEICNVNFWGGFGLSPWRHFFCSLFAWARHGRQQAEEPPADSWLGEHFVSMVSKYSRCARMTIALPMDASHRWETACCETQTARVKINQIHEHDGGKSRNKAMAWESATSTRKHTQTRRNTRIYGEQFFSGVA